MRFTKRGLVAGVLLLATACLGYGGFEVTAGFVGFKGLNQTLTTLNQQEWSGTGEFASGAPLWWLGGHGGKEVGMLTFGGSGALGLRTDSADSLACELAALKGSFEVGYRYVPADWFWLRPCLDVSFATWLIYVHSVEGGVFVGAMRPNFSGWYLAGTLGAAPGVEFMGRVQSSRESYVGVFTKVNYFVPLAGPDWFGFIPRPRFGLGGLALQMGLRFGSTPYRPLRI